MSHLYPLRTRPRLATPIWGGTRLAGWLSLPEPRPATIGEAWLVYDENEVLGGPLTGRRLADLAEEYGAALVGTRTVAHYGADFPLLAKIIDAADRLSIQVHPDDAYAHTVEAASGFHGKTEAWYILAAEAGADVTYGMARSATRDEFAAAVAAGSVEELLRRVPVAPGDTIFVPAGTLHAINAGIALFEIQQKSDLTYRVYDYGRRDAKTGQPRELHLAKALDVSDFAASGRQPLRPLGLGLGRELLVACPSFALERLTLHGEAHLSGDPGTFEILVPTSAGARLIWGGGELDLEPWQAVITPASLGHVTLTGEGVTLLRSYVPDVAGLADELLAAGHPAELIAASVAR